MTFFHIWILCCSFQNSAIPWESANSAKPLHSRGVNPTNAVPFVPTPCLLASSATLAVMREAGAWQYGCPSMLKHGQGSGSVKWLGGLPFTLSTLQAISTAPSCGKASTCTPGRPPGVDSLMAVAMLRPMAMSCVLMVTLQFMTYGLAPTPAGQYKVQRHCSRSCVLISVVRKYNLHFCWPHCPSHCLFCFYFGEYCSVFPKITFIRSRKWAIYFAAFTYCSNRRQHCN